MVCQCWPCSYDCGWKPPNAADRHTLLRTEYRLQLQRRGDFTTFMFPWLCTIKTIQSCDKQGHVEPSYQSFYKSSRADARRSPCHGNVCQQSREWIAMQVRTDGVDGRSQRI